ncbi:7450_t:CDS:2 [Diversispora eburnea]|uniref:7450_t:CDS:1 n=1 Tax=Diversispora eburnea TaxID=1213867 RepID=A0A9N9A5X2_9GLOM|nr:7450_t:CDS:2 [Diversispora eburnea]
MQNNKRTTSSTAALAVLSANIVSKMWNLKKEGSSESAKISFKKFCAKIISKSQISDDTIFLSLKYVQRYIKKGNNIDFTNEYQLFSIALMLAHKWHNDEVYTNKVWSEILYISQADIDALEISFLKSLDFKMHVTKEKYNFWLNCVRSCHRTGKREYLFTKRHEKMDKSLSPLPKSVFNYDAKGYDKIEKSITEEQGKTFSDWMLNEMFIDYWNKAYNITNLLIGEQFSVSTNTDTYTPRTFSCYGRKLTLFSCDDS